MVRFYWLLLSFVSFFLFCSPVQAGKLLFWRFEPNLNQLVFSTDDGVQPTAQLIANPTRLVIDLPATTLGQPTVKQPVGQEIREVRVGQFENQTTRIVIELAPGYTLDPGQIEFRGASPTQWSVKLPQPYRGNLQAPPESPSGAPKSRLELPSFRSTGSGFFLSLRSAQARPRDIRINRSRDRRRIEIDLEAVTLPNNLVGQELSVNRFGVSSIAFEQTSNSRARVTLQVTPDSPDWDASFRGTDALAIVPKNRIAALREEARLSGGSNSSTGNIPAPQVGRSEPAIIRLVNLNVSGNEIAVSADQPLGGKVVSLGGSSYRIEIPNARLANENRQPRLRGGIVSQISVNQQNDTVAISVNLANGYQLQEPNSRTLGRDNLLTIGIGSGAGFSSRPPGNSIVIPPPDRNAPVTQPPQAPRGRVLIVIDPGHGGKDPGAIGVGRLQEKNVILPISQEVSRILLQNGVTVRMSRDSDYFISLQGRTQFANRLGADLFVSIHANAIGGNRQDVNGLETYYYSSSGRRLADTIHRNILRRVSVNNRGVRRARFYVLRRTSMPAVLVEVGYLTNPSESANLRDPNYRSQMAAAIASGILEYIQQNRL